MIVGIERYKPILKDSLISFLHEEDQKAIFSQVEILLAEKGARIPREEQPQFLYFLLEGECTLRLKNGVDVGRIGPGRSFELKPLILHEQAWQFEWTTDSNATYMRVPWQSFESLLKKNAQSYQYLGRMAGSVPLQRLKRDLVGLGVTQPAIIEIISTLHLEGVDAIFSDWGRKVFFTLQQGEVVASIRLNDHKCKVSFLQTGDTSLLSLRDSQLSYDADESTRVWALFENEWKNLKCYKEFKKFLEVFSLHKKNLVDHENVEKTRVADIERTAVVKKNEKATRKNQRTKPDFASQFTFFMHQLHPPTVVSGRDENRSNLSLLATLALYHSKPMGQRRIENKIQGLASAPSVEELQRASQMLGFESKVIESERVPLNKRYWPAVLMLDSGFRIVFSVSGNKVLLGDPDTGTTFISNIERIEERMLEKKYLVVQKGVQLKSRRDPGIPIDYYVGLLFSRPYLILLFILSGFLGFFFDLGLPVLNQYLFDVVIGQRNDKLFFIIIGVILVFSVCSSFLQSFSQRVATDISAHFGIKLKTFYFTRVLSLPVDYVRNIGTSGVLSRFTDIDQISAFFSQGLMSTFLGFFLMLGSMSVLWLYHHWLVYVVLAMIPIEAILVRLLRPKLERLKFDSAQLKANENRLLMEHFTSTDDMRSLKGQLTSRWRWELNAQQSSVNIKKSGFVNSIFQVLHFLTGEIVKIVSFLVAVKLYMDSQLSLGQVVGTTMLIPKVSSPLMGFVSSYFQFFSIRPTLIMLNDLIYAPVEPIEIDTSKNKDMPLRGQIEFRDVSFSYDSTQKKTLKNVSFKIEPGEKVVIIGPSGSGKSSVASLVAGLYEPNSGQILIDDTAFEFFSLSSLRAAIGFVEQDGSLFAGTIQENIAWGDPEPDIERVQRCATVAEIDEEILGKPGGYMFPIQHGGLGVSEGQKQRLLLARALYRNPSMLILDESTSHLDPISEERIINRLLEMYKDKTILFFTHRVHLSLKADKVLYIEDGSLKEMGKHKELIENRQNYYEFYSLHLSLG